MIVNLGIDLHLDPAPEPLLAPPEGRRWKLLWSSEDPCLGGSGTPPVDSEGDWCLPAHSTIVVAPETSLERAVAALSVPLVLKAVPGKYVRAKEQEIQFTLSAP